MTKPILRIDWSDRNGGRHDTTGMGVPNIANAVALYSLLGNPTWFANRSKLTLNEYKLVVASLCDWIQPGSPSDDEVTESFFKAISDPRVSLSSYEWGETPHSRVGPSRFLRTSPVLHSVYYFVGLATFSRISDTDFDVKKNLVVLKPETPGVVFNRFWSATNEYSFSQLLEFLKQKAQFSELYLLIPGRNEDRDLVCCQSPELPAGEQSRSVTAPEETEFPAPTFNIMYGPPGTGKTTLAKKDVTNRKWGFEIVQFHASYSYEDFIEGIRPITFSDGQLKYDVVEGPLKILAHKASTSYPAQLLAHFTFKSLDAETEAILQLPMGTTKRYGLSHVFLCETGNVRSHDSLEIFNDTVLVKSEQLKHRFPKLLEEYKKTGTPILVKKIFVSDKMWGTRPQCLIIDEINRANINQVLGELIYVLADQDSIEQTPVKLQYSGEEFKWPRGLNIIGTMNTADTSTERLDQAIKRRFTLEPIPPDSAVFDLPLKTFSFLTDYCKKHSGNEFLGEVKSLNTLVGTFGAKILPGALLTQINNKILGDEKKKYGVIHPNDKLLGHSFFIKLCRRLCEYEPSTADSMAAVLYVEAVTLFWHEITPALLSVFNHDEAVMKQFYEDLLDTKIPHNLFTAEFHTALVDKLWFKVGAIKKESVDKLATVHPIRWLRAS